MSFMATDIAKSATHWQAQIADLPPTRACKICNHGDMVGEWLEKQFKETRRSKSGLARALDLDKSAVSRLITGERKLSFDEVAVVERYFGREIKVHASELDNSVQIVTDDSVPKLEGVTIPPELSDVAELGEKGMAHPSIVEILNAILSEMRENRKAIEALTARLPVAEPEAPPPKNDEHKEQEPGQ